MYRGMQVIRVLGSTTSFQSFCEKRQRPKKFCNVREKEGEIVKEEHMKLHAHVESFLLIHALVIVVAEFVDTRQEDQHLLEAGERLASKRLGVDPHHTRLSPHCVYSPSSLCLAPLNLHASLLAMAS